MNNETDSEEEREKRDRGLPPFTIRHKDMPIE